MRNVAVPKSRLRVAYVALALNRLGSCWLNRSAGHTAINPNTAENTTQRTACTVALIASVIDQDTSNQRHQVIINARRPNGSNVPPDVRFTAPRTDAVPEPADPIGFGIACALADAEL